MILFLGNLFFHLNCEVFCSTIRNFSNFEKLKNLIKKEFFYRNFHKIGGGTMLLVADRLVDHGKAIYEILYD